jgi:hypothetical protein
MTYRAGGATKMSTKPILAAMDVMAAHCDSYSLPASWTMRTARSINSEEYRTDFFMVAPFSQMFEPPFKPGAIESHHYTATLPAQLCRNHFP